MRALCALLLVASVRPAAAQPPDETPRGGVAERVAVGGEVTATLGSDDPGFFNYATYAYDPMRNGDGRYRIDNVPAGSYTIVGWYEGEARVQRTLTVAPGAATELDLVVP